MNYNKLVKAIQKAVPGIMELKIGVKLFNKKENYGSHVIHNRTWQNTFMIWGWDGWLTESKIKKLGFEILGRDITISEVIKAFKIFRTEKNKNFEFQIMADTYNLMKLLDIWDYSKPLHLQKPEVWEFLSKLICKKEK